MRIVLAPLQTIDAGPLDFLRSRLGGAFGCPVELRPSLTVPARAFDSRRRQYLSSLLLEELESSSPAPADRVLGVIDADLYAPGLNFVFGQAAMGKGVAVISLARLKQDYYGLPSDEALFWDRALKEAVHEIGHTLGLGHCANRRCVMHFSNSLPDTDFKQAAFCSNCRPRLPGV